jgi:uridine kinase
MSDLEVGAYMWNRRTRKRFGLTSYDPRASNIRQLVIDLRALLEEGRTVSVPTYSHQSGRHGRHRLIRPATVLLLDGINAMRDELSHIQSFRVFLTASPDVQTRLRTQVDHEQRGHRDTSLQRIKSEIRAFDRWVLPQASGADFIVTVHDNWRYEISESFCTKLDGGDDSLYKTAL